MVYTERSVQVPSSVARHVVAMKIDMILKGTSKESYLSIPMHFMGFLCNGIHVAEWGAG